MVEGLTVLNPSLTPPFYITDDVDADESLRLRYRYLDLRRPKMQDNLRLRHQTVKYIRDYLDGHGFLEIETPILIKSTPEGARDYLVPSRTHPGNFYALPQSPQQLKQLLMVSGVERYFQIARCFRDEDLRADRQPEFTQLDLEMSFVEEEDVLGLIEGLYAGLVRELTPQFKIKTPFQRLPYADAMARFGSDKPDLRYGLEMADVSDLAAETEFRVFRGILDRGGIIKAMAVPGKGGLTGADMRRMEDTAKEFGAAGMSHVRLTGDGALDSLTDDDALLSPGLRMPVEWVRRLAERAEAQRGDLILLMAGPARLANQWLAAMRSHLAAQMELAGSGDAVLRVRDGFPAVPVGRRHRAMGFGASSVHGAGRPGARRCWTVRIWRRYRRELTTWYATVRSWPAGASGYTNGSCRRRFSASWVTPPSRSPSGSGTFWKRSTTARRRTGGLRRGSTGWWRCWRGRIRCAR